MCKLRQVVVWVYLLAVTPEIQYPMLQEYMRNPRALIWRGMFTKSPDEKFSGVKTEYSTHRQDGLTVANFLQIILSAMPIGPAKLQPFYD